LRPRGGGGYPSTLLMTVVPAQVAGVDEIAVIAPPTHFGAYNADILATCYELGVKEVYRIGGAQGVAALAYGTEICPRVDKIVGSCQSCGSDLIIRRSRRGGRFIGCSGYSSGCRFTAPLPQKGRVSASKRTCKECGYPIVEVRGLGRYVWRLCINVECPTKRGRGMDGGG